MVTCPCCSTPLLIKRGKKGIIEAQKVVLKDNKKKVGQPAYDR